MFNVRKFFHKPVRGGWAWEIQFGPLVIQVAHRGRLPWLTFGGRNYDWAPIQWPNHRFGTFRDPYWRR